MNPNKSWSNEFKLSRTFDDNFPECYILKINDNISPTLTDQPKLTNTRICKLLLKWLFYVTNHTYSPESL